jgi:serine/threonine protein kinase
MEPARALDYALQIAEGLDTAYKNGVVHRDIKPQNIVINSQGVARITDFGLARSRETVTLTQSNVFMGTAYYIPPEQAESGRSADIRSDLYSVAAVLFEMLSGHPPYEGDTAVDIVVKHMNDKVPSICTIRPELPRELDQFMQKAMAKLPADRYTTPREFINALEKLQELIPAIPIDRQDTAERPPLAELNGEGKDGREQQAAVAKQARLLVLSSNQAIPLTGELMVVGRHDPVLGINPEINLADKTVGRRHAYVRCQHGQYSVEDLNALNKTRLNGVVLMPYEERTLNEGDILRFGSVEVRFEMR